MRSEELFGMRRLQDGPAEKTIIMTGDVYPLFFLMI